MTIAATGNASRQLQGQSPGWTGHVTETVTVVLDDVPGNVFDSPVRLVECTSAGNIVYTLWADDTATAGLKHTRAMAVGDLLTTHAIAKIWQTGTTATILAFR